MPAQESESPFRDEEHGKSSFAIVKTKHARLVFF